MKLTFYFFAELKSDYFYNKNNLNNGTTIWGSCNYYEFYLKHKLIRVMMYLKCIFPFTKYKILTI